LARSDHPAKPVYPESVSVTNQTHLLFKIFASDDKEEEVFTNT
jgi:hypothetical protein